MKKTFLNLGAIALLFVLAVPANRILRHSAFADSAVAGGRSVGRSLPMAQENQFRAVASAPAGSKAEPGSSHSGSGRPAGNINPLSQKAQTILKYLNERSKRKWKIEQVGPEQINIFGGELRERLLSDEKALGFVTGVVAAAGLGDVELKMAEASKRKTHYETIDEFVHKIEGHEVYNSYARLFRNEESLSATDIILEVKQVREYTSLVAYDESEVQSKMADLYAKLNYQVLNIDCSNRNFFVDAEKKAQLSYVCRMKTGGGTPQNFEIVVSAQTAKVLYQKTITIYN